MKLLDKLKDTGESFNEFYHGTVIPDAEGILRDGKIFSRWFLYIRRILREQNTPEEEIQGFLDGLYSILPAEICDAYRNEELIKNIRKYFCSRNIKPLNRSLDEDPYLIPSKENWHSGFDWRYHGFSLTQNYGSAECTIRLRFMSRQLIGRVDPIGADIEGVVFQAKLPIQRDQITFLGMIDIQSIHTVHVVYKNQDTLERITKLSDGYRVEPHRESK